MVRYVGKRASFAIGALLSAGLFCAAPSQAQTAGSGEDYSVTDPSTGTVYYYDARGNLQYYTAIDPTTGSIEYYNPDGSIMDPLHAFCWGISTCADNGTNTPVTQSNPDFGFDASSGPLTGDLILDILIPNNDPQPANITGTSSLKTTTPPPPSPWTATLVGTWTSGDLQSFIGIGAKPNNPIGAYLPSTQGLDPGATGFYVYQVDLKTQTLCSPSKAPCSPFLTITGAGLDLGAYVVGFLNIGKKVANWIATANSGALFEDDAPEPATLFILFAGVMGLFLLRRSEPALSRRAGTKLS